MVLDAGRSKLAQVLPIMVGIFAGRRVITPHPGEMARLLGCDIGQVNADRIGIASQAATQWGCVVVLKGAYTVAAAPDGRGAIIPYANPVLATAGTGDVLAGAIVGLMAQGLNGYEAAICGAYLHGLAGELRREQIGNAGMLAGDLLPLLPSAIQQITQS
jgi:NAD(P)H-hydrate epimerase